MEVKGTVKVKNKFKASVKEKFKDIAKHKDR